MATVLSPRYPELLVIKPRVKFVDGWAEVTDEVAEALKLVPSTLGLTFDGATPAPEMDVEEVEEPAEASSREDASPSVVDLPGSRASVADWVEFMAAQGIKHPDDATRAEMREIAEKHFS